MQKTLLILFPVILLVGCDLMDIAPENKAPTVELLCDTKVITTAGSTTIEADAEDADNDALSYAWFIGNTEDVSSAGKDHYVFTSAVAGDYIVSVKVSDGDLTATDKVTITVNEEQYSGYTIQTVAQYDSSTIGIQADDISCVAVSGETIAIGYFSSNGFSLSSDGGDTWKHVSIDSTVVDIAVDGTTIYTACFQGLYTYDIETSTATRVEALGNGYEYLNALAITDSAILVAADSGFYVAAKSDLTSWTRYYSETAGFASENIVYSIHVDGTHIYLGGTGQVICTDTSYSAFSIIAVDLPNSPGTSDIETLWSDGTNFVVEDNYTFSVSADGGATWTSPSIISGGSISAIRGDASALYAVKYGGPLMVSEDAGATWTSVDFPDGVGTEI